MGTSLRPEKQDAEPTNDGINESMNESMNELIHPSIHLTTYPLIHCTTIRYILIYLEWMNGLIIVKIYFGTFCQQQLLCYYE